MEGINLNGRFDRAFFYNIKFPGRIGEFKELYIFDNINQTIALYTLIRVAILCTIEERGEFGLVDFYDVSNLIDKAIKYGLLRFM